VTEGYTAPFRVRFDEAGPDGRVRTSSLLRYAQDLAWQHSDALGLDRAWYRGRGVTWLVRAAELTVLGEMASGTTIAGTTTITGFRRVWSRRHTEFHDEAGTLAAWVNIDWVLIDERGSPQRIPPEIQGAFPVVGSVVSLARVDLAEPPADVPSVAVAVRPQELDPLDHVNNAVYADWLDEQVLRADPEAGVRSVRRLPRLVRLEYARAAEAGTTVTARTWLDDGDGAAGAGWSCRIDAAEGTPLLRARLEPGGD
jgi:acyl-CoA thioesterase FadM